MIAITITLHLMDALNISLVQQLILSRHSIIVKANILQVKIKISVSGWFMSIKLFVVFKNSGQLLMNNIIYNHIINTFNYRRERSMCEICWSRVAEGDFELTGSKTGPTGNNS